jgi:uncharacterized membrane protein
MSEQFNPSPEISDNDRLWAMLSYILSPIVPIILLLIPEKRNRPFLKAHLTQSLVFGLVINIILTYRNLYINNRPFLDLIIVIASFIFKVIWGLAANRGKYVYIPVITNFCKKQGWA